MILWADGDKKRKSGPVSWGSRRLAPGKLYELSFSKSHRHFFWYINTLTDRICFQQPRWLPMNHTLNITCHHRILSGNLKCLFLGNHLDHLHLCILVWQWIYQHSCHCQCLAAAILLLRYLQVPCCWCLFTEWRFLRGWHKFHISVKCGIVLRNFVKEKL